jgi:hypothetical protein
LLVASVDTQISGLAVTPIVASFENKAQARQATRALQASGLEASRVRLIRPPRVDWVVLRMLPHREQDAAVATELGQALVDLGVPDGPARFYEREFAAGKSLVLVLPEADVDVNVRAALRQYGGQDLEEIGGHLARAPDHDVHQTDSGPTEFAEAWRDISDYYEMLFDQRYGTEDITWGECESAYRFAWELGHRQEYRRRPWTEVADIIRMTWQSRCSAVNWDRVADGMEDV